MKLLSFESSAVSAAVCLTDGEKVVASAFQNCGLTHSRTLLPMAEQLLSNVGLTPKGLDGFAVASGPGSFTGIRIGVATVKGLAMGTGLPCVGVSTLEAMAWNLTGMTGTVSCVMDARAGQVYNARFHLNGVGAPERLTPDRALTIQALGEEIGQDGEILVGDGAYLCYTNLTEICPHLALAPAHLIYPGAYGVAMAALQAFRDGKAVDAQTLDAVYLRKPQAEQMRDRKLNGGTNK